MSAEKAAAEAGAGRGEQRRGRADVRVLAAGLPRGGSRHEDSQEDKINLLEPIPLRSASSLCSSPLSHGHCGHEILLL